MKIKRAYKPASALKTRPLTLAAPGAGGPSKLQNQKSQTGIKNAKLKMLSLNSINLSLDLKLRLILSRETPGKYFLQKHDN